MPNVPPFIVIDQIINHSEILYHDGSGKKVWPLSEGQVCAGTIYAGENPAIAATSSCHAEEGGDLARVIDRLAIHDKEGVLKKSSINFIGKGNHRIL